MGWSREPHLFPHRGKRSSKALSEKKPVENVSQNPQSFLEIGPVQKKVLPLHKLQDYVYE